MLEYGFWHDGSATPTRGGRCSSGITQVIRLQRYACGAETAATSRRVERWAPVGMPEQIWRWYRWPAAELGA